MSFRIATWNVNGLRAVLEKDGLAWTVDDQPDILCLQEIKAKPEQLNVEQLQKLAHYPQPFWNPAQRPGYSGVATFCLEEPCETLLGLGLPEFDTEGRVIVTRHPEFLLFNIYFPNGQRDQGRLIFKLDFYAALLELYQQLDAAGEKVILCGDFNTAHNEIDLRHPKANVNTSGFMPVERAWIDRYLERGLVDAYRQLYPEKVEYTWWTYRLNARQRNIGWRLDYFLVSEALLPAVRDVQVIGDAMGSDHCPVMLELDL
jgi:exodeoxyribonuclease III